MGIIAVDVDLREHRKVDPVAGPAEFGDLGVLARLLLADPAIVVLDEATSHLDAENERAVQQALDTALAGRTAVVIAHRLSTVTSADQILVLDAGRIVERGVHDALLAAGGLYADLYRTLVREAPDAAPIG